MDDVTIANRALQAQGTQSRIMDLSEGSTESDAMQLIFASTRQELLRKYRWGFSRFERSLAVYKAMKGTPENPTGAILEPPTPWLYSYTYPPDCLKPRYIKPIQATNSVPGVPLMGVGMVTSPILLTQKLIKMEMAVDVDANGNQLRVILCSQQQATLVYSVDVPDPNIWDVLFATAMVGRLVAQTVTPLSGDKTLAKIAIQDGMIAEKEAEATDANDTTVVMDRDAPWIEARGASHDALSDYNE